MSKAIVKQDAVTTVGALLKKHRDTIIQESNHQVGIDRIFRVALSSIQRTPALQDCTPISLFYAITQSAILGLECDGTLGEAYLVPFGNTVTFMPGYRGYITLARRSGEISTWKATVIYENDDHEILEGLEPNIYHKPNLTEDRGNPILFYSVVKFKDGSYDFEVMMHREVQDIMKRSKSAKGFSPWKTDFNEMAKKTVMRRHAKRLPLKVDQARIIELDNQAAQGESQDYGDIIDITGEQTEEQVSPIEKNPAPKAEPKPKPAAKKAAPKPKAPKEPSVAPQPAAPEPEPVAPESPPVADPAPAAEETPADPLMAIVQGIGEEDCLKYFHDCMMIPANQGIQDLSDEIKEAIVADPEKFDAMVKKHLS
jgi:recombination protein RecT